MSDTRIEITCESCREKFAVETRDNNQRVTCPACGEDHGTWRELKAKMINGIGERLSQSRI